MLYSLMVAGFVMLGGKAGKRIGSRRVFQVSVLVHGVAMGAVAFSINLAMLFVPQLAAALVPTLVVMIATHYRGKQQAQALGFLMVEAGSALLAYVVQNDWGTPLVIVSLLVIGLGEGALLTLVFNVLVSSSPKALAADVGALRGTCNNLSTAMGTALAGALAIGVLGVLINNSVTDHPTLPPALIQHIDLDQIDFVRNDELRAVLEKAKATPHQVTEAVAINEDARLQTLKISFLVLGGIALLAIIPASGLPPYVPADHYPALAAVPRDLFGIYIAAVDGRLYAAGDSDYPFTIMSVAKPFVFALVCQALGAEEVRAGVGVNGTGLPFNSVMAVELNEDRLTNPMVNSGALATTSPVPGRTVEVKWQFIEEGLSAFAGRMLGLNDEVYASAAASSPLPREKGAWVRSPRRSTARGTA